MNEKSTRIGSLTLRVIYPFRYGWESIETPCMKVEQDGNKGRYRKGMKGEILFEILALSTSLTVDVFFGTIRKRLWCENKTVIRGRYRN